MTFLLSTSVKCGQEFISFTSQKKTETQTNAVHATSANTKPVSVLNGMQFLAIAAYILIVATCVFFMSLYLLSLVYCSSFSCMIICIFFCLLPKACTNYLPLGTAVTDVGNNLHLILPEGTFPLPMSSANSPVTSVLTPVGHVPQSNSLGVKQICLRAAVTPRYVNIFTEEFLKTTPIVNDAFEKAIAEEKTVYNRSANKLKYVTVAVNSLKRLKYQTAASSRGGHNLFKYFHSLYVCLLDDITLFQSLNDYILPEEMLIENNYPIQHTEKLGSAVLFKHTTKGNTDRKSLKRTCCRCGATYSVSKSGKHVRKEECNYHYGRGVERKVPGGVETHYSCCQGVMGAPGCQVFQNLKSSTRWCLFVLFFSSPSSNSCMFMTPSASMGLSPPGPDVPPIPIVYSLDCVMCYTVSGLALSRVSVANSSLQVIYDTFVRPDSEVITQGKLGNNTSLREVQETLMSFINADTILIGHSLETALCALKVTIVVDTSVVFPHRLGPPHKRTLNHLTAEYLCRIIQESVCGHNTAEDAAACMELMLWKTKEDGKLKK
uniref:Exonuclease domain-containing protein n=1 Tax=Cynoglossus semilaevis TaxID=244447 RepID=A0A3P8WBT9_CYNSE